MVGVFASLKWRLVTARLRSTHGVRRVWTILGLGLAALVVGLIAAGLAALRLAPGPPGPPRAVDEAVLAVVGLFSVQLIAWVLSPLIAFGVDETVDPARFALLPIRRASLQRGLLTSSLMGYFPAANAVVLLGAAIAISPRPAVLPVALAAAATQLVTCIVFSRAAATSMSSLMTSRRGRDLGVLTGFLLVLLYFALALATNSESGTKALGSGAGAAAEALRYSPPGVLARLPSLVATGQWVQAGLAVLTAAALLVVGWWWWRAALSRSLTTTPSTTAGSAPAGRSRRGGGRDRPVANSLTGTIRVVAARDVLLAWRDPMRRMPWLMVIVIAFGWPLLVTRGHGSLFAVLFGAILAGAQAGNQLAIEGSGLWLHLVAFADRTRTRGEVLGHAAAAMAPGVAIIAGALVVHAALRGDVVMLPAATGVCLAGMLGAVGLASWTSVALPYPMPQSRTSMFAAGVPGGKARATGASLAVLAGGLATAIPAGILTVLSLLLAPGWGWAALLVGVVSGGGVLAWLTSAAAGRYRATGPEILATVTAGDRV